MKEAAREIVEFTDGVSFEAFASDRKLRYAIERQLMVIGEAARKVSPKFKEAHPEIPWDSIVGQRNILAHEYGEVLVERIWRVAVKNLPVLLRMLDPLIPPSPKGV